MPTAAELIARLSAPLEPRPTGHAPRLETLSDIRAVVFDIYGTLLISGSGDVGPAAATDSEPAFAAAMGDAGLAPAPGVCGSDLLHQQVLAFQDQGRAQGVAFPEVDILVVWRRALAAMGIELDGDEQIETLALSYECRVNPVWPMPGLASTLAAIRRAGLAMGIVSNAQFYTPLLLSAFLGRAVYELGFEQAHCAWSYRELQGKPSTALFEQVLRPLQARHAIMPGQVLYVGNDMLKDIWPASTLGMRTALFAGDERSLRLRADDSRCATLQPDVVVDGLDQLLRVIA